MSYLPWDFAESKSGSIGIAIPGGTFMLEDEHGAVIESANITGELVYKGRNVTLGYAENRFDLERGDDNNSILHTGDMARRDEDGYYYIVGRKKRFLKLFGNRVNLDEVEGSLRKTGVDCACTGDDDRMLIYITDINNMERVGSFICEHTSINRNGYKVFVIDKIPRNESGKIIYSLLK
jgi:acyl-coenzyme A synthetase/AMP-(fatty) acid ligase